MIFVSSRKRRPRRRTATLTVMVLGAVATIGIGGPVKADTTQNDGLQGWEVRSSSDNQSAVDGLQGWEVSMARSSTGHRTANVEPHGWEVAQISPQADPVSYGELHGWEVAQAVGDEFVAQRNAGSAPSEPSVGGGGISFSDTVALVGGLSMAVLLGIAGAVAVGRISAGHHRHV